MSMHGREVAVGDTFALDIDPVSTTQLVRYAGASGDYNRIHYDAPYAEEAGLGGVIAHGMLTMAFMGRALTGWAGEDAAVGRLAARFTAPVRPGDVVSISGTVSERKDTADGIQASCQLIARVGEKKVAMGDATVTWHT